MPSDTLSIPETLLQIAEKQERRDNAILKELREIRQSLERQSANKQPRRSSKVNELVGVVLMQHNDTNWTAASMGRAIGVTGQAVGQCKQWKKYNELKIQGKARQYRYRLNHTVSKTEMDEIDKRIDSETKD
jgi:hypothetical protein